MRPRLLDLFCCAGGASTGYSRAGFDLVGVDIEYQANYPFEFHQADALEFLAAHALEFDAIAASPPCQAYSVSSKSRRNAGELYPDLLGPTRDALEATGKPWIIENVPGAPMRPDYKLCGCYFGLDVRRERWFETSWQGFQLAHSHHHPYPVPSVVGSGTPLWVSKKLGHNPSIEQLRDCMGIDWTTRRELSQAIPPAYTEYLGGFLIDQLAVAA